MDPITQAVLGVLATVICKVLLKSWRAISNWFKEIINKILDVFERKAPDVYYAIGNYVEMLNERTAAFRSKVLFEENNYYVEEVRENYLRESNLPSWVRAKIAVGMPETDITDEVREELQLTY